MRRLPLSVVVAVSVWLGLPLAAAAGPEQAAGHAAARSVAAQEWAEMDEPERARWLRDFHDAFGGDAEQFARWFAAVRTPLELQTALARRDAELGRAMHAQQERLAQRAAALAAQRRALREQARPGASAGTPGALPAAPAAAPTDDDL